MPLGIFTLAYSVLRVPKDNVSHTMGRRLGKFSERREGSDDYVLAAPLIAQLGKNDLAGGSVDGHELLALASEQIAVLEGIAGGRFMYLECESVPALMAFYEREGFRPVAERASADGTAYHVYARYADIRNAA